DRRRTPPRTRRACRPGPRPDYVPAWSLPRPSGEPARKPAAAHAAGEAAAHAAREPAVRPVTAVAHRLGREGRGQLADVLARPPPLRAGAQLVRLSDPAEADPAGAALDVPANVVVLLVRGDG